MTIQTVLLAIGTLLIGIWLGYQVGLQVGFRHQAGVRHHLWRLVNLWELRAAHKFRSAGFCRRQAHAHGLEHAGQCYANAASDLRGALGEKPTGN
jgi:hypothetical protein